MIHLILLTFAFVFFVPAGLGIPENPRFRYLGWGLACWVLSVLLGGIGPR